MPPYDFQVNPRSRSRSWARQSCENGRFWSVTLLRHLLRYPEYCWWLWYYGTISKFRLTGYFTSAFIQAAPTNFRSFLNSSVPGVLPERFAEGLTPQHCALSLVGEPIMYPEINAFIRLLHEKQISTFLVTNAQFPDAIKLVRVITLHLH